MGGAKRLRTNHSLQRVSDGQSAGYTEHVMSITCAGLTGEGRSSSSLDAEFILINSLYSTVSKK